MRFSPVAQHNAIERMAFGLVCIRDFSSADLERMPDLHARFKDQLPKFETTQAVVLNVVPAAVSPVVNKQAGALMTAFSRDGTGRPEWELRVEANQIVVTCHDYTRWSEVWPKAHLFLQAAAQLLHSADNGVQEIALNVIDRFVCPPIDAPETYSVWAVFRGDCPHLTKQVTTVGPNWHVHSGWFEDAAHLLPGARVLHQVNLSGVLLQDRGARMTIDHRALLRNGSAPVPLAVAVVADGATESLVGRAFNALRERNMEVIKQTMNDEQLAAVGIAHA